MKPKLELDQAKEMTWEGVFEYYFGPEPNPEFDYFLWNMTCYPLDTEKTLDQIYEYYIKILK